MANPPDMQINEESVYTVVIETERGDIEMLLDPGLAPKTVNNFIALANDRFYDGVTFHRVEPGFVIQGGDPDGTGMGGPGYKFEDEPVKGQYLEGTVAMANAGPDTNGSQFFICTADTGLPPKYNLFGHVTKGMDVVKSVQKGDKMNKVTFTENER